MQNSILSHLKFARFLATALDKYYLDPIINFIPVIGNWLGLILALYIVWIGHNMGLPNSKKLRMLFHIFVDFVLGSIPFLGFLADFFYGANLKNLAILEKHAASIAAEWVVE